MVKLNVNVNYPSEMNDEVLLQAIKDFMDQGMGVATGSIRTFQESQFYFQLAQVGQIEYSNRVQKTFVSETKELKDEITSLKENNDRYSRKSMRLSSVTISLAIVTIFLAATTIWFSKRDMESDQTWRDDQMVELKKNNELLQEQIRVNEEASGKLDEMIACPANKEHN